ncbi:hypothetical protein [Deinococcus aestuarii]|uniref:hypothetical protein n=1 Tax=Deinococcus aestuarii TaxID=2774531 RepID=UPI001C0C5287|nr:hypothetical protein [Deinococcus aestuarii]
MLDHAEWDLLEHNEKELVCFRLKDKTTFPHHGVALAVNLDLSNQTDECRLQQVVGKAFLEWSVAGLPRKDPRYPYLTVFIDVETRSPDG